jgi:hypothetical protein
MNLAVLLINGYMLVSISINRELETEWEEMRINTIS